MNTKTNACGKVFSSCSDDYKKLYYMVFYKQHVYIHWEADKTSNNCNSRYQKEFKEK